MSDEQELARTGQVCSGCGCLVGLSDQAVTAHHTWHESIREAAKAAYSAEDMTRPIGGTQ
jgi:hypothetical protein